MKIKRKSNYEIKKDIEGTRALLYVYAIANFIIFVMCFYAYSINNYVMLGVYVFMFFMTLIYFMAYALLEDIYINRLEIRENKTEIWLSHNKK